MNKSHFWKDKLCKSYRCQFLLLHWHQQWLTALAVLATPEHVTLFITEIKRTGFTCKESSLDFVSLMWRGLGSPHCRSSPATDNTEVIIHTPATTGLRRGPDVYICVTQIISVPSPLVIKLLCCIYPRLTLVPPAAPPPPAAWSRPWAGPPVAASGQSPASCQQLVGRSQRPIAELVSVVGLRLRGVRGLRVRAWGEKKVDQKSN